MSNLMNLNEIKPNPDGNPKIYRICKSCEYFERCGMKPSKYAISREFCNYHKAFNYVKQYEAEEQADERFRKMRGKDSKTNLDYPRIEDKL